MVGRSVRKSADWSAFFQNENFKFLASLEFEDLGSKFEFQTYPPLTTPYNGQGQMELNHPPHATTSSMEYRNIDIEYCC